MNAIGGCILILKREYIIVFGVNLKIGINLRNIVIDFIIVHLFRVGPAAFPFKEKGFST